MTAKKPRIKKADLMKMTDNEVVISKHPEVSGVTKIGELNSFPISWIQKQGYCEYQIYLEHFKKIKARPTFEMIQGSKEHHRLEAEFIEKAEPSTFEEMLDLSKEVEVYSREFPVYSKNYGIHGLIDEIKMTHDSFIIIDDKPGNKPYKANIFQVLGYCLAFKEMSQNQNRKIFAGLRERGTDNIFFLMEFDNQAETEIISSVNRMHRLIENKENFIPTENPNKCLKCRFKYFCDKKSVNY